MADSLIDRLRAAIDSLIVVIDDLELELKKKTPRIVY